MNQQERMMQLFKRLANRVVASYSETTSKRIPTYDRAPYLMHNMQMLNYTLTAIAIKAVKKMSGKSEVDTEQMICDMHSVIHGSVKDFIACA